MPLGRVREFTVLTSIHVMTWYSKRYALLTLGSIAGMTDCRRPAAVVPGRVPLSAEPKEIALAAPVGAGPSRGICFHFNPPGESRRAEEIHVVLRATNGDLDTLRHTSIDRRGESMVCLVDEVADSAMRHALQAKQYSGIILWADTPLIVNDVTWSNGQ